MSNGQITIEPENGGFYRPVARKKTGILISLVLKLSGGRINEAGANYFLLGFAVIIFIIAIVVLVTTL
ncbi:MAG TPA: hypothetical protein VJB69_03060 [Candidatus Paceibacterota bacterium]